MSGFLLDTCVISEFRKPLPDPSVQLWLSSVDPTSLYLSAITIGELSYGIETLKDRRKRADLERWLATEVLSDFKGRILSLDSRAGRDWGSLRAAARLAGKSVPVVDTMVAAIARQNGLALVTRNERDFEFAAVKIVNPWGT